VLRYYRILSFVVWAGAAQDALFSQCLAKQRMAEIY
jgi:hypothetical protein